MPGRGDREPLTVILPNQLSDEVRQVFEENIGKIKTAAADFDRLSGEISLTAGSPTLAEQTTVEVITNSPIGEVYRQLPDDHPDKDRLLHLVARGIFRASKVLRGSSITHGEAVESIRGHWESVVEGAAK